MSDAGKGSGRQTPPTELAARSHHLAVADGDQVVVWGGLDTSHQPLDDGAILHLEDDTWQRMAPAPVALESARGAIRDGQLLIVGGWNQGRSNSHLLVYDLSDDRWESVDLRTDGIVDWTLTAGGFGVVSRGANGTDLTVTFFDRGGKQRAEPTTLSTSLGIADYVGVTSAADGLLVAASDQERTELFEVDASGRVTREAEMEAASFAPARRVEEPFSGSMARDGDRWVSAGARSVSALSVERLEAVGNWELDACQTAAAWVAAGEGTLLRYGGQSCGGDTRASRLSISLVEWGE